jgi:hypothetical protein
MSTSIQEQDLIQTIKQLEQRISDLERQQRAIGTNFGNVFLETNQLRIGQYDTPGGDSITIQSDVISLGTQNSGGDITSTIELNWDAHASNKLSISGSLDVFEVQGTKIILTGENTPASSSASGQKGTICWNSTYLFICVATNSWKRIALSTF